MSESTAGGHSSADGGIELAITGMGCSGCVSTLTHVLGRVPGVTRADVELASGRARIEGNARVEELLRAVEAAGYGARVAAPESA